MKKLIIAAGIAAATMASFNASANTYLKDSLSHASVNSVVTGSSVVTVNGVNGGSFSVTDIKGAGNDLGTFGIQLPDNSAVLGFGISGIHSHGFPQGFKVKFNECTVAVSSADTMTRAAGEDALPDGNVGQECVFANSIKSVAVKTDANPDITVKPGTKTITADFTAYTN